MHINRHQFHTLFQVKMMPIQQDAPGCPNRRLGVKIFTIRPPHGLPAAQTPDAPMRTNPHHAPLDGRSNGKQARMDRGSVPDTRWMTTISAEPSHTLSVELLRCIETAMRAL